MAKTKLGMLARTVSANAVAKLLEGGGTLRICAGPWGTGSVLVELPVKQPGPIGFDIGEGWVAIKFQSGLGQRKGTPTWARCLTSDGQVVFELDVGGIDSKAAIRLDPLVVHPHGTVLVPEVKYIQPG